MINIVSIFVSFVGENSNLIMFFFLATIGLIMLVSAVKGKFYGPGLYLGYTGVLAVGKETVRKGKNVRIFCSIASFFLLLFAFAIYFSYEYSLTETHTTFFIKYFATFLISIIISIAYYPLMRISTNYFFKHQRMYWIVRYFVVVVILLLLVFAYLSY